ncbi:MAG: hypothetical protein Q8930_15435 [Bacillota bacterium]|nr:hypothetical protein [Bacillota bacterium]
MLSILDSIYCGIKRDEIRKLGKTIQRLSVNSFYEILTKDCWEFGIQYETLVKNNEVLEIKLWGVKRRNIIKFHRCAIVSVEELDKFVNTLERHEVNRGIYVTTGSFELNIIRKQKKAIPSKVKVKLEDGFSFYRKQAGWLGNAVEALKIQNLKLYRYLPE